MFEALGVLVGAYALYAAVQGEVYAKSGPWGTDGVARGFRRTTDRAYPVPV